MSLYFVLISWSIVCKCDGIVRFNLVFKGLNIFGYFFDVKKFLQFFQFSKNRQIGGFTFERLTGTSKGTIFLKYRYQLLYCIDKIDLTNKVPHTGNLSVISWSLLCIFSHRLSHGFNAKLVPIDKSSLEIQLIVNPGSFLQLRTHRPVGFEFLARQAFQSGFDLTS